MSPLALLSRSLATTYKQKYNFDFCFLINNKAQFKANPQTAAVSINGSVIEGEIYVIIVKAEDSATTDKR
jgi:hypothetical protein